MNVEEAKAFLKSQGFFTDNLWHVDDVKSKFNCDDDEAHYISNATAQRTRLLNDILEQIPKVWLLTGTPMTSRPINYFNLLSILLL